MILGCILYIRRTLLKICFDTYFRSCMHGYFKVRRVVQGYYPVDIGPWRVKPPIKGLKTKKHVIQKKGGGSEIIISKSTYSYFSYFMKYPLLQFLWVSL